MRALKEVSLGRAACRVLWAGGEKNPATRLGLFCFYFKLFRVYQQVTLYLFQINELFVFVRYLSDIIRDIKGVAHERFFDI